MPVHRGAEALLAFGCTLVAGVGEHVGFMRGNAHSALVLPDAQSRARSIGVGLAKSRRMEPWSPSLIECLAVTVVGMLAHERLHRALPVTARPVAGTMIAAMLGMLAGLVFDASRGRLELLDSLCGSGLPLGQLLRWHLDLLLASNAALVLAGVLPLLWRLWRGLVNASRTDLRHCVLPTLLCVAFMFAGMNLGMPLLLRVPDGAIDVPGLPAMLAAMQAGMSWGAVVALAFLRVTTRASAATASAPNARD